MRRKICIVFSLIFMLIPWLYFSPKPANAFPGFARKYNFPCAFCHIQWPRLADTGHFFKDRGFMLSTTGRANALDLMFMDPKNQNYFPIGFHMAMAYKGSSLNGVNFKGGGTTQNPSDGPVPGTDGVPIAGNGGWANGAYSAPFWDIESGGLIGPWISFWVQPGGGFSGGQAGAGAAAIQVPAIDLVKLWIRFDDILHSTWLNLYVGKTSNDSPESTYRATSFQMVAKGDPYMYEDYEPGISEIVQNDSVLTSGMYIPGLGSLYNDGDDIGFNNAWAGLRYFGYHFEGDGQACHTQNAFSIDPCETRVDVFFVPNSGLYATGSGDGGSLPAFCTGGPTAACTLPGNGEDYPSNGWNYLVRLTQSFGGWGRTNGEQVGVFGMVGEGAAIPDYGGGANPMATFTRFGAEVMINPIPNGNLNIDAVWDIVTDPTGLITPALPGMGTALSGLQYMAWVLDVSWQPTFGGRIPQTGPGSNLIEFIYNQVDMTQQPQFSSLNIPGNFNDVQAFSLTDRYWLWGSDRADVSLFAEWMYMVNDGVAGVLSEFSSYTSTIPISTPHGFFGNVEANNFDVGVDFAY